MSRVLDYLLGRVEPLEGTRMSLWNSQIPEWWSETFGDTPLAMTPATAERVWVANRCVQLNAQQIASMPLEFRTTAPGGGFEPAWVSAPDPTWYPNGISDAIFAVVRSLYGWGYAILLVTTRYANGFPQSWTVADPDAITIEFRNGRRVYKANERELNPLDVVQIDRNPGTGLHGTSAIRAYASQAWGLLAASEQARSVMGGGVPQAVLKSKREVNATQVEAIQTRWMQRVAARGGAPPVLGPNLDFETLSFSPSDLMLIEGLEFNSRVLASAFGVPAFLLNLPLTGGLNYQNPAMLGETWWRFELRPTAKRIADALSAQMLPRGSWVTFDASDTFAPITGESEEDDPQLALDVPAIAGASPADLNGTRRTLRPMEVTRA